MLTSYRNFATAPCGLAQYDVVLLDCTLRSGSVRRGPSRLHPAVWLSTTWSVSTAPCCLAQYDVVLLDCTLRSGSVRRGPSRSSYCTLSTSSYPPSSYSSMVHPFSGVRGWLQFISRLLNYFPPFVSVVRFPLQFPSIPACFGAVALTVGSAPRRIVFELRQFD